MFSAPLPYVPTMPPADAAAAKGEEEAANDDVNSGNANAGLNLRAAPIASMAVDPSNNDDGDMDGDGDPQTISAAALADAEHLDRLEASDSIDDIASFQDVELPKDDAPTETATSINSGAERRLPSDPDGIRRAKRYYYCLPVVVRYRYWIAGCSLAFVLLILAVSLSARDSEAAANAAKKGDWMDDAGDDGDRGEVIINDAPPLDYSDQPEEPYADWYGQAWGDEDEDEDDEVGDPFEAMATLSPSDAPRDAPTWFNGQSAETWPQGSSSQGTGEEELGVVFEASVATLSPTDSPREDGDEELGEPLEATVTDLPTDVAPREDGDEELGDPLETTVTDPPTDAPREPGPSPPTPPTEVLPAGPRWYLTDGTEYGTFLADVLSNTGEMHSHLLAGLFCQAQGLWLCSYQHYCPDGKGNDPYEGAPDTSQWNTQNSLESVQWAPVYTEGTNAKTSEAGGHWVQVGSIPEDEEGDEDNNYGKCWTWDEWNPSQTDIEALWGEDHRRWMLCCEREEGGGDDRRRII